MRLTSLAVRIVRQMFPEPLANCEYLSRSSAWSSEFVLYFMSSLLLVIFERVDSWA